MIHISWFLIAGSPWFHPDPQWLEALFIALKYRKSISREPSQVTRGDSGI